MLSLFSFIDIDKERSFTDNAKGDGHPLNESHQENKINVLTVDNSDTADYEDDQANKIDFVAADGINKYSYEKLRKAIAY